MKNKIAKIIVFTLIIVGLTSFVYAIYNQNEPMYLWGFAICFLIAMFMAFAMSIKEISERNAMEFEKYNKFLDHLSQDEEYEAYEIQQKMNDEKMKTYMLGILIGKKTKKEEYKTLKKEMA